MWGPSRVSPVAVAILVSGPVYPEVGCFSAVGLLVQSTSPAGCKRWGATSLHLPKAALLPEEGASVAPSLRPPGERSGQTLSKPGLCLASLGMGTVWVGVLVSFGGAAHAQHTTGWRCGCVSRWQEGVNRKVLMPPAREGLNGKQPRRPSVGCRAREFERLWMETGWSRRKSQKKTWKHRDGTEVTGMPGREGSGRLKPALGNSAEGSGKKGAGAGCS